jgi:hypothetical protein
MEVNATGSRFARGLHYSVGRCSHWIKKVKNPKHPAFRRVQDQF